VKNTRTGYLLWTLMLIVVVSVLAAGLYVWRQPDAAQDEGAPLAAASTGRVTFLMEQQ